MIKIANLIGFKSHADFNTLKCKNIISFQLTEWGLFSRAL